LNRTEEHGTAMPIDDQSGGGIRWAGAPIEIAIPPLRWSVLYGTDDTGAIRWVLRQHIGEVDDAYVLDLPDRPHASDLAKSMTPVAGRPIADTLVHEVVVRLPAALVDDRPSAHAGPGVG
jgi:hypothetical protein